MPPRPIRRKRVGRPRKRKAKPQAGGQLGILAGLLGPIVAKEIGKRVIPALGKAASGAFRRKRRRRQRGRGLKLAGAR